MKNVLSNVIESLFGIVTALGLLFILIFYLKGFFAILVAILLIVGVIYFWTHAARVLDFLFGK